VEAVRALLVEGGADATAVDELGETAKTLAVRKHHLAAAAAIDCCKTAVGLRAVPEPQWPLKEVKNLLQLSGVDVRYPALTPSAKCEYACTLPPAVSGCCHARCGTWLWICMSPFLADGVRAWDKC